MTPRSRTRRAALAQLEPFTPPLGAVLAEAEFEVAGPDAEPVFGADSRTELIAR